MAGEREPLAAATPAAEPAPAAPSALRFMPWADLRAETPPEPLWVLEHYIARGAVTLLAGKPKSGKSTLVGAIASAVDALVSAFLRCKVSGGPVVFLSEESAGTFAPKLSDSTASVALTRDAAWPKPTWAQLIAAAVAEAQRIGAVLLVIDALSFWAAFGEGDEKDAGRAQATMDALGAATGAGLAVLLVHHQRKSGGEDGDAVRGSSAIFGAVDMLIELERVGEDVSPGHRRLVAIGRWPQTPPVLLIDRDSDGWRVVGQAASRHGAAALGIRERVLAAAPLEPQGATEAELVELVDVDKRKLGGPLRELVRDGLMSRTGAGARGNPYRYAKVSEKVSSAGTLSPGEKVSKSSKEDTFTEESVSVSEDTKDRNGPGPLPDSLPVDEPDAERLLALGIEPLEREPGRR